MDPTPDPSKMTWIHLGSIKDSAPHPPCIAVLMCAYRDCQTDPAGTFSDDDPRAHARARTPVRARARPPTHSKGEKVQGRGACAAHMGALAPLFESYDPANIKYLYLTV